MHRINVNCINKGYAHEIICVHEERYNNVSSGIYIDVPRGCCVNIAVENTSDQDVSVANANIVVTREA